MYSSWFVLNGLTQGAPTRDPGFRCRGASCGRAGPVCLDSVRPADTDVLIQPILGVSLCVPYTQNARNITAALNRIRSHTGIVTDCVCAPCLSNRERTGSLTLTQGEQTITNFHPVWKIYIHFPTDFRVCCFFKRRDQVSRSNFGPFADCLGKNTLLHLFFLSYRYTARVVNHNILTHIVREESNFWLLNIWTYGTLHPSPPSFSRPMGSVPRGHLCNEKFYLAFIALACIALGIPERSKVSSFCPDSYTHGIVKTLQCPTSAAARPGFSGVAMGGYLEILRYHYEPLYLRAIPFPPSIFHRTLIQRE